MPHEHLVDAVKATPPAGILLAWLSDIGLQQWVLVATLVYTILLIAEKLYKFVRSHDDSRRNGP